MRKHHPFRSGAGPAGIKNFRDGVFVDAHDVGTARRCSSEKLVIAFWREPICLRCGIEKIEILDSRGTLTERIDDREKILLEKKHLCAGVIQDKSELLRGEANIQREQDGTGVENTIVGFQQTMAVHTEEGDAIAGLHSSRA